MTSIVGIYLFDDVEILDFAGPYEVFSTASRVKKRLVPKAPKPFDVITVSKDNEMVRTRGEMIIKPKFNLTNHPEIDVLIVPGGIVTNELKNQDIIDWISKTAGNTKLTASVCTGSFLLAKAGLLSGESATTHWEDIKEMRRMFPDIKVLTEKRWVDIGHVVTSAGISAGIDMSLHLVARIENEGLAIKTARQMEFDWQYLSN